MKQMAYGVVLTGLILGLVGAGCARKGTISPEFQLRDPEAVDKKTASLLEEKDTAVVGVPLSLRQFGVPAYPGARSLFTEQMGSPDSDGQFQIVQMATPDSPPKVAAFYERHLPKEAQRQPVAQGNSAMFVWYRGPRAGQTLLIAEDGKGQTLITVGRTAMSTGNPLMLDTSTLRPEGQTSPDRQER
jgi:hypothetical protein